MATGVDLALPEPIHDEDARSSFKHYKVCVIANRWNDQKKLLRLPMPLKGRAWAIYVRFFGGPERYLSTFKGGDVSAIVPGH